MREALPDAIQVQGLKALHRDGRFGKVGQSRFRRVVAAASGRYSWMLLASALTGAAFVVLHGLGVLGTLPLWLLMTIFVTTAVVTPGRAPPVGH